MVGAYVQIALRFAYIGSAFPNGYARQPEHGTVEDSLLDALRHEGYVDGSWRTGSRTDKGVSAAENVAACTIDRPHLEGLLPSLQSRLPDGVWVTGAVVVPADWNPRFHAVRTYSYTIQQGGEDLTRMQAACAAFAGEHDMNAFAKLEEHRDPVRHINRFTVEPNGHEWRFTVSSPGFLWNQVRRMVHAVLVVGRGGAQIADIQTSLATGEPHGKFNIAPAEGLLLESVRYDPPLQWISEAGPVTGLDVAMQEAAVRHRMMDLLRADLNGSS